MRDVTDFPPRLSCGLIRAFTGEPVGLPFEPRSRIFKEKKWPPRRLGGGKQRGGRSPTKEVVPLTALLGVLRASHLLIPSSVSGFQVAGVLRVERRITWTKTTCPAIRRHPKNQRPGTRTIFCFFCFSWCFSQSSTWRGSGAFVGRLFVGRLRIVGPCTLVPQETWLIGWEMFLLFRVKALQARRVIGFAAHRLSHFLFLVS